MECYLSDLEDLRKDLETHLQLLTRRRLFDRQREHDRAYVASYIDSIFTEDTIESPTWVPLELELQITCLDGEVSYQEDALTGSFSIRIMVQTPIQPEEERSVRVYTGCEGSIDIQEVITFCTALRACIEYYEHL